MPRVENKVRSRSRELYFGKRESYPPMLDRVEALHKTIYPTLCPDIHKVKGPQSFLDAPAPTHHLLGWSIPLQVALDESNRCMQ